MERKKAKIIGNLLVLIASALVIIAAFTPTFSYVEGETVYLMNIISYFNTKVGFGLSIAYFPLVLLSLLSLILSFFALISKKYWKYNTFIPFLSAFATLILGSLTAATKSYIGCAVYFLCFILSFTALIIVTRFVSEKVKFDDEEKKKKEKTKKEKIKKEETK